jgi:hypothetical protein
MSFKDIHQIISEANTQSTELLGRELGIEIETFGAGLAHVAIMKRQFNGMKNDYAELLRAYEILEKQFDKIAADYKELLLDCENKGDWK